MLKQGKYISAKTIIEKIFRDVDYAEQLVDYYDCIEWMWEVIELVKIPMTYIDRLTTVSISDYKGILPSDFESIIQIRDSNTLIPLKHASNLYYKSPRQGVTTPEAHLNTESGSIILDTEIQSGLKRGYQYAYNIDNGYIYCDAKDIDLELSYKAYPIDNYGFPMILEDMKLIRALETYIIWKIDYKAWRRGMTIDKVYMESKDEYLFAIASVSSESKMPDMNMMESIYKRKSLLVQDPHQYNKSFKYLGG